MSRRLKFTLIVAACLILLGGTFLWALPEIVRRVALAQIPKHTGRAAAIADVDLNLFTGRLAIKHFRLAEREGPEPFVEFERLDVRLSPMALLRSHIRVAEIALVGPSIRVVRTAPLEFNFSDVLARLTQPSQGPQPPAGPSHWILTVEHLSVAGGRVRTDDRALAPPVDWRLQDLHVEANGITTRAGAPPGRLTVRAKVNEAVLTMRAEPLRLAPLQMNAQLSLEGFELGRLDQYVYIPMGTPYRPKGGRLRLALAANVDSDAGEVRKAVLSGTVDVEGEAVGQVGRPDPFLTVTRLGVEIKEADALTRSLTVANVAIEGLDLKARRDAQGLIDLLEMLKPKPTPATATAARPQPPAMPPSPPPAASPPPRQLIPVLQTLARGFEQIRIERITLGPSTATFVDETVRPTTTLSLTKLQARIDDLSWPVTGPATLNLSTDLPGGGTLKAQGPVTAQPFQAELTLAVRDAPVAPYQAYIPVPARLSGRYNGDSQNRIALRDGTLVATSKGNSWAENVEIRAPGAKQPAIRVERMELAGIDFDWPKRAALAKAVFRRPRAEVERAADGTINLRQLFTAPEEAATAPRPGPAPASGPTAEPPKSKGLLETMRLDFREVRVEDGFIRFLDRTMQPAFSQDLSRLQLTATDLGNRPGRRGKLNLRSMVGGDANLDVRGEIGPLGGPAFIELVGELRSFKLPTVDPYAVTATGWAITQGELQYKVRFKLEGDQVTAENDVAVGHLQVAPAAAADEVKQRLGLPLGLIVALIKDQRGDIRVNVPVTGSLKDPKFDFRDAIWGAIKNVLANIVSAPFKAIGRLFSGGEKIEEPKVDPVTFAPGSSVLSPDMEAHLLRVADFLRKSPFVNLALTSVPSSADVDALKNEAVTARLREFQKARGLDSAATALAAYYKERLPRVPFPATLEEQLALLREQEPAPEAQLAELARRRVEATRERLLTSEGIPAARLLVEEPSPASAKPAGVASVGRVEFGIAAGG